MKQIIIITNNPKVITEFSQHEMVIKETMHQVYLHTRDLIHLGHKLLNHPLAGSVKPNETPYRSLMVTLNQDSLDFQSLTYIESAIRKFDQFQKDRPTPVYPERVLEDFQQVDFYLFTSGYQSLSE